MERYKNTEKIATPAFKTNGAMFEFNNTTIKPPTNGPMVLKNPSQPQ